ncbi:MAG TPA: deoxynucleoside kinase [Patescibacteria group bacterium]|jgi:dTMP kinase|nr:deoxynucleoside kinase [Patescibacteria group bacterium]
MYRGKIIVIDGTDGSGKATQAKLLVAKLKRRRIPVATLDFPHYESFTGKLVARYLKNEFGRISPYLASLLYAINRYEYKNQILDWIKAGKVIILNRYVSANQIHQAAHLGSKKAKQEFVDWVAKLEFQVMGMPSPSLTLFLNLPVEISYQLIKKKNKQSRKYISGVKRDILESDLEHQKEALKQAFVLLRGEQNWKKIDCVKNGKLLSKPKIADLIWQEVSKQLKI